MTVLFGALHTGQRIVIYGDGTSSRDYTHVDDIAHALQLALEGDVPGGTVLHIASGVETTITELADLCRNAAGQPDHPWRTSRGGSARWTATSPPTTWPSRCSLHARHHPGGRHRPDLGVVPGAVFQS